MDLTEFREQIITDMVNSQLSIDCIYYVMLDVMREVKKTHNDYLYNKSRKKEIKEMLETDGET